MSAPCWSPAGPGSSAPTWSTGSWPPAAARASSTCGPRRGTGRTRSSSCSATSAAPRTSRRRCAAAAPSATWPPPPTSARSRPSRPGPPSSTRWGPSTSSRRRAARASSGSCTPRPSGSTPTLPGDVLDEDALLAPPAHLYTAGKLSGELFCRSYAELYGLRPHGPALRHPLRPAGPTGRRHPQLRPARAGRHAADDRRQRRAGAVVRLRRGPRRGRRPGAAPARRRAHVQPRRRRRRRRSAGWPRSVQAQVGRRADRPHRGPRGRPARGDGPQRPRRGELGWTASTPLAEGVRALRGLAAGPARGRAPRRAPPRPGELARRPRAVLSRLASSRPSPPWPAAWRSSPSCPAC